MSRSSSRLIIVLSILSVVAFATPHRAHASGDCDAPRCGPYHEDPGDGCLGPDDPFCAGGGGCQPESIFDHSCDDQDGPDRCSENCRICETRNGRYGCYATHGAGSCECHTDFDDLGNLYCQTRGTCSVTL